MQTKQTITAVIPAKNEESNIKRCLESLTWCDKIVVMSMGDDKTGEIATKMGAEIVEMNKSEKSDFIGVQKNINWAIDHATTDWILRIDADEVVTPELRNEIQNILTLSGREEKEPDTKVAYGIPRKQFFWGGFLTGGDWAYDRLVRLFRPAFARYQPIVQVHEQFKVEGEIGYLENKLEHYSHPTLHVAVQKFNDYTDVQIHEVRDSFTQALFKMIFLPPYIFLRWFFWHHGYRDGIRGVVAGLFRAWYEFLLYSKYLEKKLKTK